MSEKRGWRERDDVEMDGVREYGEGYGVVLGVEEGRPVLRAFNEAGHSGTDVDLLDVIVWLRAHRPDLLG